MALLEIKDLTFSYPGSADRALDGITLDIEAGEFLLVCGASGGGKSTLLRHMKTVLAPHGERSGMVAFAGRPLEEADLREQSSRIGFVSQNADNQIVTDKVWHEIAFGLESLGFDNETIRLRTAEMASFFGIQEWYHKSVLELSGGQKQMLNLASVMCMQPDVLILDEPTSQLDPIAATDIFEALRKINDDLGTTIIISEHRLEEVMALADRVAVMGKGKLTAIGSSTEVAHALNQANDPMLDALPTPMRTFLMTEPESSGNDCPVTVREGRAWLARAVYPASASADQDMKAAPKDEGAVAEGKADAALSLKEVWFRYDRKGDDILRGLTFDVRRGEMFSLVGGNGTGKTTALKVMAGLTKPYRGRVRADKPGRGGTILLPQDPTTVFTEKTIRDDLATMFKPESVGGTVFGTAQRQEASDEATGRIEQVARMVDIADLLDRHPFDISGGEQQRAALAKILLADPRTLLLDEPTKGLDAAHKNDLARILQGLIDTGVTIIMVSHDVEYCAAHSDRCALFFDGSTIALDETRRFFAGNSFYTTAANRMTRRILDGVVTAEDIIDYLGKRQENHT